MAYLIAKNGLLKGTTLDLTKKDKLTIGRDAQKCDIVLKDNKVSREHILCSKTEKGFIIKKP